MSGHDEFDLSIYDDEYLYGDSGPRSPTGPTDPAESYAAYAAAAVQQQQQQQPLLSPTHAADPASTSTNAAQKRPHPDSDSETDARPAKVPATSANVEHAGDAVAPASSAPQEQYDTQDTAGGQPDAPSLEFDISHIQQYRDPNATSALIIEDLSWWTSDRDDQACVKDITFNEHKVNGKSRGSSVYVQFTTPDMAAAAKVGFENIEIDQRMPVVRFADPHFNPFRVLPKDGQNRNLQQQQHHQGGGGFRPPMHQNFQGGQGGGYRPPFNNNNNNMNPNQGPMGGGGGFGGGQGMVRPPPGGQFQQRPPQGMGGYGNAPPSGPYGGGPGGPGMGMGMGGQYHQRPPHQGFPNRPPHLPPPPAQLPPPPGQGGYYGRPPHQQQQQPQQGGFGGMNGGDRRGSGVGQY
ncbi:hypothetical protein BCR44DRAFT_1430164 [Catenaria anguillulae PL171]|uniref:RRM domain-containing protein n=1 Tax=Catenaria anguillulae PL171 TaxID=765915 RepID=A0A1Y2HTH3_9FUNG|nr:hypothetical protein BCR44DRAFT_1430164 [Catenaria anguillulae PL171]